MTERLKYALAASAGRFPLRPGKPLVRQRDTGKWGFSCVCVGHNRPDLIAKPDGCERHNCDSWKQALREAHQHVAWHHKSPAQYEVDALEADFALPDAEKDRPVTEPRNEPPVYNYSEVLEDLTVSNAELHSTTISASTVTSNRMVIPGPAGPIVTIHPDGTVELGPNATPDEAARAFWDAVQRLAPSPAVQQFGAPLAARIDTELAAGQRAQKQVQRLDQMATAWSERLPNTLNRDTVVEAIHQVTRPEDR